MEEIKEYKTPKGNTRKIICYSIETQANESCFGPEKSMVVVFASKKKMYIYFIDTHVDLVLHKILKTPQYIEKVGGNEYIIKTLHEEIKNIISIKTLI